MIRQPYSFLFGVCAAHVFYPLAERATKRCISPKTAILRQEQALSFAERKKLAVSRLIRTLMHAKHTVPYYKDLFSSINFMPEKIESDVAYLEEIPYLTKDILREQGKRLISETYLDRIAREQKTGSSTGLAATIYYDQEGLDWTAAQNILMLQWGGKRRYHREAHLSTRFAELPTEAIRFETKKCLAMNRQNIYTDGFSDAAQEQLLKDLKHARAIVVQGHPSSLFALARYLNKQNRKAFGLFDIFVSTGEMITPKQRELIEQIFGVQVANRYGACEFGVMAQERTDGPKGQLMVSDSLVWPEIRLGKEALIGELVFTNLRNLAMPLIRYQTGDLGQLEEREDGWWISELTGRVHDSVTIGGTLYPTHYIQDILDRCGPIADFQILTKDNTAVEMRLVTPQEHWEFVQQAVANYFPSLPLKRIRPEDLVFVGIRGKFSYLVRENA